MHDVIVFLTRRPWLRNSSESPLWGKTVPAKLVSKDEFCTLKETGTLGSDRDNYLTAFMHGWLAAKK